MKTTNHPLNVNWKVCLATTSMLSAVLGLAACSKKSDDSTTSSSVTVTNAIGLVQTGVNKIGSGLGGNSSSSLSASEDVSAMATTAFASNLCNSNGVPLASAGGSQLQDTAAMYPYLQTYCGMTISSGDTVRGGFSLAKSLICSLEKGGITFTGSTQSITADFADTTCWPDGGPGGQTGTVTLSAVGSAPASFNSHFEKVVVFSVDSLGLTFKIAANLSGDKIEFIANESWSGSNAGTSAGNVGSMAGEITKSTGVLRFEKRDERVRSDCTTSSCGWNRHTRIYAVLTMTNGEPSGLTSFSYGYSDIQVSASTYSGSTNTGYGKVVTAKGALSSGIKARLFNTSTGRSLAQMKDVSSYAEQVNTGCATSAGFNDAANCTSNTGIGLFTSSTKFTLMASSAQTSPASWLTSFTGFTFTDIDLDTDNAF